MKVPTLYELEEVLKEIEGEVNEALDKEYGTDPPIEGHASGIGSSVMYLDRRKPLYKFLASIP